MDAATCIGCGDCVERCQFGALCVPEDVSTVDELRCVGCWLCATVCPVDALQLARRPAGEVAPPPANGEERQARRRESRAL